MLQRARRPASQAPATVEARLQALDRLLADGAITAAEHAERRAAILASI
ncbi:SHOCT domain-containing protein [Luteimonas sp. BDR2-5]|nr:SHOCT domain-containing protein [Luteimonas sp. BDR2-5]